jgi:hypothetical protein
VGSGTTPGIPKLVLVASDMTFAPAIKSMFALEHPAQKCKAIDPCHVLAQTFGVKSNETTHRRKPP